MINGIRLNAIITLPHMIRYFVYLIMLMVIILFVVTTIASNVYDGIISTYSEKLAVIEKYEAGNKDLMCTMVKCKYLVTPVEGNRISYKNHNGMLETTTEHVNTTRRYYFSTFNNDWLTIINYKGDTYLVDDSKFMGLVLDMTLFVMMIAAIFYTITGGIVVYFIDKTSNISKSIFKNELESKLQRDLAESLHHEMGMPLAIIESSITELFANLYPCRWTEDNVCDFANEVITSETCASCVMFKPKRSIDKIAIEHYGQIKFGIARLSGVIRLVAGAKHIKYSNGNVSLFMMIENITAKVNSYKVSKFRTVYVNKDLLHKYAVGKGITNGEMLNVFNVMVNNSVEAKASEIIFRAEQVQSGKLDIYVEDNGRGIRDCFDNIVTDETIFKYGYSTKDEKGNQIVSKSWWKKILYKLGLNLVYTGTPRGVGLSVNKGVLAKTGGDLSIVSTSATGTVFKITLPIKEKRNDH